MRLLIAAACVVVAVPWTALAADAGVADDTGDAGAASVAERPAREEPPEPLASTSDVAALSLRHVHVVLERKGDRMEVSELLTFASREGTRFFAPKGLHIPIPSGAVAPRTMDADGAQLTAEVDAAGFAVVDPIGPGGDDLSVTFEVPIEGGVAAFEQRLPVEVVSFQVVSTWTRAPSLLRVAGAKEAVRDELQNGLVALIATGRGPENRTLAVTLSGIEDGGEKWVRRAALAICAALFAAGVFAFARRKRRERGEAP
jgi:hypothetical protein